MKNAILIIAALTILIACNQGKGEKPSITSTSSVNSAQAKAGAITWDSTYTVVDFIFNYLQNDFRTSTALHGERQSFKPDPKDQTRNISTTEAVYVVWVARDSVDKMKKPVADSLGKTIKLFEPINLPTDMILQDYHKSLPIPKQK